MCKISTHLFLLPKIAETDQESKFRYSAIFMPGVLKDQKEKQCTFTGLIT